MRDSPIAACVSLPVRRGPRAAELTRALAAVDRAVPGLSLPALCVSFSYSRRYSGGYAHAGRIELSRHAEHLGIALLHELGHALDHLRLGTGRAWGSETRALEPWWRAVQSTRAFARLGGACDARERTYWASRRESFARSFVQWTAMRAGEHSLVREVERRAAGAGRQWSRADFAPVGRTLDEVLLPLGP